MNEKSRSCPILGGERKKTICHGKETSLGSVFQKKKRGGGVKGMGVPPGRRAAVKQSKEKIGLQISHISEEKREAGKNSSSTLRASVGGEKNSRRARRKKRRNEGLA